ncbi:MAG: DUF3168 domain-containing protein [Sphingomonas bacterium]|nr:DUF3168 domain-containing protein [Sphingomonas bacterium]
MSARILLQAGVLAALQEAGLAAFDAAPLRRAMPHVVVEEPVLGAMDATGVVGRVGTIAVSVTDAGAGGGERPERLRMTLGAVEAAVGAMPRDLPESWRIAGLRLGKSRIVRGKSEAWIGTSEFQVRLFRITD